jgi:hypothetical protein
MNRIFGVTLTLLLFFVVPVFANEINDLPFYSISNTDKIFIGNIKVNPDGYTSLSNSSEPDHPVIFDPEEREELIKLLVKAREWINISLQNDTIPVDKEVGEFWTKHSHQIIAVYYTFLPSSSHKVAIQFGDNKTSYLFIIFNSKQSVDYFISLLEYIPEYAKKVKVLYEKSSDLYR